MSVTGKMGVSPEGLLLACTSANQRDDRMHLPRALPSAETAGLSASTWDFWLALPRLGFYLG